MIEDFRVLIEQLGHAVTYNRGKTTLTETDIRLLQSAYRELKRYDDMAKLK
jgi:hypothetical protein